MLDSDISTTEAMALLHTAERDPWAVDRRRFLQLVGMGVGAGLLSGPGSTLLDHALGHDPAAWAAGPIGSNDGILLIVGMFGGNDGLNTVVPYNDGLYYQQHGSLAIPGDQTWGIAPGFGLHPNLGEIKRLYDLGQVAVVNGVGYPNADFSHFNSMAYWMAGQPGGIPSTGWAGRWLDGYLGSTGRDLYAAAEVGYSVPLHLIGHDQRGTVVPAHRPSFGAGSSGVEISMYNSIRSMNTTAFGPWHSAVGQAMVDQIDLASTLAAQYPDDDQLPTQEIVARLEIAARMINANLGFRILTAGWGDFDSHANQPDMHPVRMAEFNAAIKRFYEVLDPAWTSRVTIMTFSEFGRTSWSNDGQGTDHGSAAPQFVIGANVKGGMYGSAPSLAGLERWERMPHTVDFRSYYASIIDGWLGGGSSTVLGGNFENLGLFSRGAGYNADGSVALGPATLGPPSSFVPIAPVRLVDTRDGTGGVLNRPLSPGERIRVPIHAAGGGAIPGSGVTAIAVNVTSVESTTPNYFTVYPGSTARPGTSNLNGGPGRPVPNLVVMGVGTDGMIEVYNSHGYAHCLVDAFGYFTETAGDRFNPLAPARLFDSRTGQGVRAGKVSGGSPADVQVAGFAGVPGAGATAVVLNLTITEADGPGWMRAIPAGQPPPTLTSNVNFGAGDTVPNLVMCKLGDGGRITVDGGAAAAHVIGDVFGYFTGNGAQLRTIPPQRLLDTRIGLGARSGAVGPSGAISTLVGGRALVPSDAVAVVLNVTATNVTGPGFVTVWPHGETRPGTSNLNVAANQTVANLVICRLGAGGALQFANPINDCDLIADVLGYFTA